MMTSVTQKIKDLCDEVKHIPGCLCQPIVIGVNKPFKNQIQRLWERWMIYKGIVEGITPTREHILKWTIQTIETIML